MEPWEQARVDQAEADERETGKWLMRFAWAVLALLLVGGIAIDVVAFRGGY